MGAPPFCLFSVPRGHTKHACGTASAPVWDDRSPALVPLALAGRPRRLPACAPAGVFHDRASWVGAPTGHTGPLSPFPRLCAAPLPRLAPLATHPSVRRRASSLAPPPGAWLPVGAPVSHHCTRPSRSLLAPQEAASSQATAPPFPPIPRGLGFDAAPDFERAHPVTGFDCSREVMLAAEAQATVPVSHLSDEAAYAAVASHHRRHHCRPADAGTCPPA